jgi:hypothetical protein
MPVTVASAVVRAWRSAPPGRTEEHRHQDLTGQRGHLGVQVSDFAGPPVRDMSQGLVDDNRGVVRDPLLEKWRLGKPPLAEPNVGLARDEAATQESLERAWYGQLAVEASVGHQDALDQGGVADQGDAAGAEPEAGDVAELGAAGEKAEEVFEFVDVAAEQAARRAGGGGARRDMATPAAGGLPSP